MPSVQTLTNWFEERGFYSRKDLLDARVSNTIDDDLVALKVQALREQAGQFRAIRMKAAQHILDNDFDSSSSAVSAFIKSSEQERIALGMSRTMQKLAELDDDGLLRQVKELAARVSGDIIDAADAPEEGEEE